MMDTLTTGEATTATWEEVTAMADPELARLLLAQGEKLLESTKEIERRLDAGEQMRARLEERVENAVKERAAVEKRLDALQAQLNESTLRVVANGIGSVLHGVGEAFKARPREFSLTVIAFLIAVLAVRGVVVESQYFNIRQGTGGDDDSEDGTWAADDDDHDGGTMGDDLGFEFATP